MHETEILLFVFGLSLFALGLVKILHDVYLRCRGQRTTATLRRSGLDVTLEWNDKEGRGYRSNIRMPHNDLRLHKLVEIYYIKRKFIIVGELRLLGLAVLGLVLGAGLTAIALWVMSF